MPVCLSVTVCLFLFVCQVSLLAGQRVGRSAQSHVSQYEGDGVLALPVAGVKQMRQHLGRKVGQALGTVEGVVDPFVAPPALHHVVDRVQVQRIQAGHGGEH